MAFWPEYCIWAVARHVKLELLGEYIAMDVASAVLSPVAAVRALLAAASTHHTSECRHVRSA